MTAALASSRPSDKLRSANRDPIAKLTRREQCVLAHMANGESNLGISRSMYLSAKTVEAHIGTIFTKLGLYPEQGNRRVLAVLAWLAREQTTVVDAALEWPNRTLLCPSPMSGSMPPGQDRPPSRRH